MTGLEKRFPIYSRLLYLYPEPYRKQYAEVLLQTTADLIDDTPKRRHPAIWLHVAVDLPVSAAAEQIQYIGGAMHETPTYIRRNSLLAGLLLVPFFTALAANIADQLLRHQTLYQSWLWRTPLIQLWVLYLPVAALLLAVGSYFSYIMSGKSGAWRRHLFDLRHAWPVAIPAVLALGILFVLALHDTGQCWLHTPSYLAGHLDQTWQCTVQNQSLPIFTHLL